MAITSDRTVLVTEGHMSLAVVSAFEVGFLTSICIAGGQRARREAKAPRRGGRTPVTEGMIRLSVYTDVVGFQERNTSRLLLGVLELHVTETIDLKLAILWTGLSGLSAGM